MSETPGTDAGWRPYSGATPGYQPPSTPPRTLSVTSMVLALSSVLVSVILGIVGLAMAIAAIVLGILAVRREPHARAFWLTGIIVGGAVVILAVGGFIALIVLSMYATASGY